MATVIELQDQLETAWKGLLSNVKYDHDVAVRSWRDGSVDATYPIIIVQASTISEGPISGHLWQVMVSLHVLTYDADDEDQTVLNSLFDSVFRRAVNITQDRLQTELTDIEVHGVYLDGTDAALEEHDQRQTVSMACHVQADLASVTTTTTTSTTSTTSTTT